MFFLSFFEKMQNAPYFWLKNAKKSRISAVFRVFLVVKGCFFYSFVGWGREEVLIKCFGFVGYCFVFTVVV